MKASVRGARLSEMYEQFVEVVETVCVLAVIGLGVWEISAGRMTLGRLLAFAAFIGYLYPPVRNLGRLGLTLTAATAGAQRLGEILDAEPAVTDPAEPVREWPVRGWVSVHGAGKSTLAKLLLRFYAPSSGALCLDGVPLNDVPLEFLRENMALLPQETLVLHGTIRENIECGRPGAPQGDIERAAQAAAAHEFIAELPDGYDTVIAPGTAALSGGQLKRVAIARAMLRAAPVLILDEPTAGLDSVAARRIVQPLRRLVSGRTTIMITHDLSLAPDADRILVVDGGRLVERGGTYARLAFPGQKKTMPV